MRVVREPNVPMSQGHRSVSPRTMSIDSSARTPGTGRKMIVRFRVRRFKLSAAAPLWQTRVDGERGRDRGDPAALAGVRSRRRAGGSRPPRREPARNRVNGVAAILLAAGG